MNCPDLQFSRIMLRWQEVVGRLGQERLSALVRQLYLAQCDQTYRDNMIIGERVSSFASSPSFFIEIIDSDDETSETRKGKDAVE